MFYSVNAMVKGRNTRVVSVRIPDSVYATIEARAKRRGMSISEYLSSIIRHEVLRRR